MIPLLSEVYDVVITILFILDAVRFRSEKMREQEKDEKKKENERLKMRLGRLTSFYRE
jgi:hypothetical protein